MQDRLRNLVLPLFLIFFSPVAFAVLPSIFTVVIDPGHGGKDTGTQGIATKEKDVVLSVGLKLGKLINEKHPDVRVLYTRNSDVFIPLDQRANIANKAKANLFISIHADHAETPTVKGASTFTLGQNRSRENFEIAKRENAVILLEDNYKQRYEGFDPNSAESYIMFEFMQDNYMNQSIQFASTLQDKFVASGRKDRGVRQDVFLVLRCTSMPSVLVELGFLSNYEEEQFLRSESGQDQMAESLLRGFTDFKNNYERKTAGNGKTAAPYNVPDENYSNTPPSRQSSPIGTDTAYEKKGSKKTADTLLQNTESIPENKPTDTSLVFKIQMIASTCELSQKSKQFKGISMDHYQENGLFKYTYGEFLTFEEANRKRRTFAKMFPGAFVVAFKNGVRIPIERAKTQVGL